MRIQLISTIALATLAISPSLQAAEGLYVAARGSYIMTDDADSSDADGVTVTSEFEDGYGVGVAVGMKLPSRFRVEGELFWQENDIDSGRVGPVQLSDFGGLNGDIGVWGGMVNGYYDFLEGPLVPFIGVGVGYTQVDAKVNLGDISVIDDDDTVLAYQGILGVSYDFMPNLQGVLAYRYLSLDDPQFQDQAGGKVDMEYDSQSVDVGLRYSF